MYVYIFSSLNLILDFNKVDCIQHTKTLNTLTTSKNLPVIQIEVYNATKTCVIFLTIHCLVTTKSQLLVNVFHINNILNTWLKIGKLCNMLAKIFSDFPFTKGEILKTDHLCIKINIQSLCQLRQHLGDPPW